jgi:hypothetical protein
MYAGAEVGQDVLWDYGCWPEPSGRPYDRAGRARFTTAAEVYFPPSDIPLIANRLASARRRATRRAPRKVAP